MRKFEEKVNFAKKVPRNAGLVHDDRRGDIRDGGGPSFLNKSGADSQPNNGMIGNADSRTLTPSRGCMPTSAGAAKVE